MRLVVLHTMLLACITLLMACGDNDIDSDVSLDMEQRHDSQQAVSVAEQDERFTPLIPQASIDDTTPRGEHIVKVLYASGTKRVYQLKNGTQETRTGGTRAWRNNNEGNLEFGQYAKSHYAVGTDSRFAVFPSEYLGFKAKETLIFTTKNYRNLSLFKAIHRYAPSVENNTSWYYQTVKNAVGVDKRMSSYSENERQAIIHAMRKVEGWRKGKVHRKALTAVANACYARDVC